MRALVVSIPRPNGREVHYVHSAAGSGNVCCGCGDWERRDSIAPVTLLDGGEIDPDGDIGAYLCEPCSMRLPTMRQCVRDEWPDHLTALEVAEAWMAVRRELKREAERPVISERVGIMDLAQRLEASIELHRKLAQIGRGK